MVKKRKLHKKVLGQRQKRRRFPRYRGEPKLKKGTDRYAFLDVAGLT